MSFWSAIVLIVGMLVIYGIVDSRRKERRSDHPHTRSDEAAVEREQELKAEIEQLRERLHVLERIATDDREAKRLASEIDRLRDE